MRAPKERLLKLTYVGGRSVKANRQSAYYIFEDTVQKRADDVAIWSRQGEYTWRELNLRANQYATYFLQLGVLPGDLVAFYMQNSPEFFFAWVGLLAIGAIRPCPRPLL